MLPTPRADLKPNTVAFEVTPLVKATGFREYDARWLLGIGTQPARAGGVGPGARGLFPGAGRASGRRRPRLPLLFAIGEAGAVPGPGRLRLRGAGHRPRALADGLFRPVRPGGAVRRHGHRQPQRERLDRREDGRPAAADLRPRRDRPGEGDGAERRGQAEAGRQPHPCRRRDGALHRRRRLPLPAYPAAEGGLRLRQRHRRGLRSRRPAADGRRGDRDGLRPRLDLPALQSQPGRHRDAALDGRARCASMARTLPSASTATATAAAWWTTRARRSSPTRSA